MVIVHINSMYNGSTGKIMRELADISRKDNDAYISYPLFDDKKALDKEKDLIIGNRIDGFIHHILGRITGFSGFFSNFTTGNFIKKLDKIKPDVIHIHNLHNCYINIPRLFEYIKEKNIKAIWTLHDCWAFTGQCVYYTEVGCQKWETQCKNCKQLRRYPKSYVDVTKYTYRLKKKTFSGVKSLVLVSPSLWLKNEVRKSFLQNYDIEVINNGVDLSMFKPRYSDFKERYQIRDRKVILGIAFSWDRRKGFDNFCELSKIINKDKYQIVMIGVSNKQRKYLDEDVICLDKTNNQLELSEMYSVADVFYNPTREEVFGLVNIEALACGTPVVTYDVGGCKEIIDDSCGKILGNRDITETLVAIEGVCEKDIKEACIKRAAMFDKNVQYKKYIELYEKIFVEN